MSSGPIAAAVQDGIMVRSYMHTSDSHSRSGIIDFLFLFSGAAAQATGSARGTAAAAAGAASLPFAAAAAATERMG